MDAQTNATLTTQLLGAAIPHQSTRLHNSWAGLSTGPLRKIALTKLEKHFRKQLFRPFRTKAAVKRASKRYVGDDQRRRSPSCTWLPIGIRLVSRGFCILFFFSSFPEVLRLPLFYRTQFW